MFDRRSRSRTSCCSPRSRKTAIAPVGHHGDHPEEQNEVIRHEDVSALLVSGIAGSGKTSVLLQRIAYLFYRHRDTLSPEDVFLVTPNPVFQRYIENVLPDGREQPSSITFESLMTGLGLGSRDMGRDVSAGELRSIDERLLDFALRQGDFADIRIEGGTRHHGRPGAWRVEQTQEPSHGEPARAHWSSTTSWVVSSKRIKRLAKSEKYQDMISDLSDAEQIECFGENVFVGDMDEAELASYTERFLRWRYAGVGTRDRGGALAAPGRDWHALDRLGKP